ncbi:MAG: phosphoenolpyruvate carboxylase, partial [Candidatus Sumerlaeia bacterium]|nr:phosphoenolpyruvate carboxylase [Candidatus Sumerlaeia bacterium]
VFSWNQSRHFLTSWYGAGSALQRLKDEHEVDFSILTRMIHKWPLLRNVLYNVETSLASALPELMRLYASLVEEENIREKYYKIIHDEYERSGALIDEVFRKPRVERRPRMMKTIEMRDKGLRILHQHQVELVREWRKLRAEGKDEKANELLPRVLLSINAISAGLRTTG